MRRHTVSSATVPLLLALAVTVAAAACGDDEVETTTTTAAGLVEVRGYLGVMDCPGQWQHSTATPYEDAQGSPTPEEALALLTPDLGLPPGTAQVESEATDEVVYLFTDAEGRRLGRVKVVLWQTGGWLVAETEECA